MDKDKNNTAFAQQFIHLCYDGGGFLSEIRFVGGRGVWWFCGQLRFICSYNLWHGYLEHWVSSPFPFVSESK